MSFISKKISLLREERNLTQDEFAELCGLSRSSIARYELGSSTPNRVALTKIAAALNISTSELLGEKPRSSEKDDELWDLREQLRRDPERRMLFDAARDVRKEDIMTAVRILDALKGGEENAD